jgi:YVTN family beta-propeller protein
LGVVVDFAALGGGVLGATKDTSDAAGLATTGSWTLGSLVGTNSVTVTAGALPAVTFTATSVAGAPARLAFATEPTRGLAGNVMAPVQVEIQDPFGNRVLPAKDFVTVGLGPTPPDSAAKLVGTASVSAINGLATFPNLAIDSAGIGYTLIGTAVKLTDAQSKPFDIGGVIAAFTSDRLQPVAAAFNPTNGLVYVAGANNTLAVLDPTKGPISLLPPLQSQPFGVAVNAQRGKIYVSTALGVVVIDGATNTILRTIPVGVGSKGIAVDEKTNRIYVAVTGDSLKLEPATLVAIDGVDDVVVPGGTVTLPAPAVGVAFNSGLVYLALPRLRGLAVVNPAKPDPVLVIDRLGDTYGVAVDVGTNLVYVTNRTDGTVSVIDPVGSKEIHREVVGLLPEGVGVDRGVVFVANSGDPTKVSTTVSLIDGGKHTVFATLVVGPGPKAIAVDPVTGRVFVPTFGDDRVRVIQP